MKIYLEKEITIKASAEKVWSILADEYEKVGDWATIIPESAPRKNAMGKLEGRTCSSSYGDVKEMITNWDKENMTYSYQADGLPPIFKKGGNVWSVQAIDVNACKVNMDLKMEMATVPGLLMGWMLKPKMSKDIDGLMEDLKHYVERGVPHPKKVKSLEKWNRSKAKKAA